MNAFSLAFAPLLPPAVLWGFAALALGVTALGLFRRRRGTLLRGLGLGLLLLALIDPSLVRENRKPLKDVVAIVVDESASQTIDDRAQQTQKALVELKRRLRPSAILISGSLRRAGTTPKITVRGSSWL